VFEHALGFREAHDRFAADRFEVKDFLYLPPLGLGIVAGALFVVFRAFAPGLVFGGDANPDADLFSGVSFMSVKYQLKTKIFKV